MDNQEVVVVKKKNTVWKIVAAVLAVAALCLVAAKVYQKFFKKKKAEALEDSDELPELDGEENCDEEAFEVPAEAVIVNAADMEEAPSAE